MIRSNLEPVPVYCEGLGTIIGHVNSLTIRHRFINNKVLFERGIRLLTENR